MVSCAADSDADSPARGADSAAQREADELADLLAGTSVKESEGGSATAPEAEAAPQKAEQPSAEAAEAAPSAATKFAAFRAEQRGACLPRFPCRCQLAKRP